MMRVFFLVLVAVWLMLFPAAASGLDGRFSSLSVNEGLSSNFVRVIHQDQDGFIWLGTLEGLERFDGVELRSFNSFFPSSRRAVNAMAESADGRTMWIGTDEGLHTWNRSEDRFIASELLSRDYRVLKLGLAGDSLLLVATDYGLFLKSVPSGNAEHLLFHRDPASDLNQVTDILCVEEGVAWLSTLHGLVKLDLNTRQFEHFLLPFAGASANRLLCLESWGSNLVLGSRSDGLFVFRTEELFFERVSAPSSSMILSIEKDVNKGGRILVGTDGGGLYVYEDFGGSLRFVQQLNARNCSLNSNTIYAILSDVDGNTWLGTYSGGVHYLVSKASPFEIYRFEGFPELAEASVRSILFSDDGEASYVGTREGLYVSSGLDQRGHYFSEDNSLLRSNIILSLHALQDGILVGTYGGGVLKYAYKEQELFDFTEAEHLRQASIYGFSPFKEGLIWIASLEGLLLMDEAGRIHQHYSVQDDVLPDDRVYSIHVDRMGRIWVGTMAGFVVYAFENGRLLPLLKEAGAQVKINHFYEDEQGNVWVATENEGVFRVSVDLQDVIHYTERDGLISNSVAISVRDDEGFMWFATLKGLCVLNLEKGVFRSFSLLDGLPVLVFNPAALSKGDKRILMGAEKGLVSFFPHQALKDQQRKSVVITDVWLSGKHIDPLFGEEFVEENGSRQLIVREARTNIEIRFVGMDFTRVGGDAFVYRLKGYEKDWLLARDLHTVEYTNLPPGDYQFEVLTEADFWQENFDASGKVFFRVAPPFYKRAGGQLIFLGILLLFLGWFLYQSIRLRKDLRNRRQEARSKLERKYETSRLDPGRAAALAEQLKYLMATERVYRNSELKVADLAALMKVSIHELSQVINQQFGQSFNDYINHCRIVEVKEKMREAESVRYTLLAIAEDCGFNSKSSFYRSFKKITGKTPAEYMKELES